MIKIDSHPVWKGVNPFKKRGHLARIFLAKQYAKLFPRSLFIGITGSVGKTTTTIACKEVLATKFETLSTTDTNKATVNLDPIFNLPMTILKIRRKTQKILLELGIEYPGEMEFYLNLVKVGTGIVTRIYYQHAEFLGDIENILAEKGKLIESLPKDGYAILNFDDPLVRKLGEKTEAEVVFFGTDPKNCHIWAGNLKIENFQTVFELNYGVERIEVKSNLLGFHQIYPLLAATALGLSCGISLTSIKKALENIEPAEHRMQVISGHSGSIIIDDTYNAAPIAVEEALETLNQISARRRIVILGEMRELGEYSIQMHQQIARKIYKDKVDLVFLGGGEAKYIYEELIKLGFNPDRIESNLQNPQIVSKLLKVLAKGDVVLVKGARGVRLDEVVKRISKGKS